MPANHAALPIDILEQRSHRDARHERLFRWLLKGCALIVLASLLGAAGATLWGGREAFSAFGWHFLVSSAWDPGNDVYGAVVPVYGTIATSLIALPSTKVTAMVSPRARPRPRKMPPITAERV